jgi:uncharacterized membrane protein YfcA
MKSLKVFLAGGVVGSLGGLVGLGGAEFRLPLLIGVFGFTTLDAVIINKITSLIVVSSSIPLRSHAVAWSQVADHLPIVVNLLSGSLVGAWLGAHFATRMKTRLLDVLVLLLLIGLAIGMIFGHGVVTAGSETFVQDGALRLVLGTASGVGIGLVAAILGVAGGELIIPTLILIYGVDIKLAGSLSLCISLPTMLVAFFRYAQSGALELFRRERPFLTWMALGSIAGSFVGGTLVGIFPADWLVLVLGGILLVSALKTFWHLRHR